jgi:hypothetical protein
MATTYDVTGIAGGGGDAHEQLLAGADWDAARHTAAVRSRERNWSAVTVTATGTGILCETWVDGKRQQPGGRVERKVQAELDRRLAPAADMETLAREMYPAQYAAITDDHPMDPALVRQVQAELDRRREAQARAAEAAGPEDYLCALPAPDGGTPPEVHIHIEPPPDGGHGTVTVHLHDSGAGLAALAAQVERCHAQLAGQLAARAAARAGKGEVRETWALLRGLITGHLLAAGQGGGADPLAAAYGHALDVFGIDLAALYDQAMAVRRAGPAREGA